jgi:hypothetical protein
MNSSKKFIPDSTRVYKHNAQMLEAIKRMQKAQPPIHSMQPGGKQNG